MCLVWLSDNIWVTRFGIKDQYNHIVVSAQINTAVKEMHTLKRRKKIKITTCTVLHVEFLKNCNKDANIG